MEDKRFSVVAKDPKFRRAPKIHNKIKIDKRFQSMFTDKKFHVNYTVDKRGKPVKHRTERDLKQYYQLSSEDESSENESSDNEDSGNEIKSEAKQSKNTHKGTNKVKTKSKNSSKKQKNDKKANKTENKDARFDIVTESDEEETSDIDGKSVETKVETNSLDIKHKSDKKIPKSIKERLKNLDIDYARGETSLFSDSSSDDEETDEELSESEEIDHRWGELDAEAERTDKPTYRLAACNLDWDRIRAVDLMVLFNSFLPPGGAIRSVVIYPSEFGKQRLKEEEVRGPIEVVESKKDIGSDEENEEGSKYHMEKLRQYQLNRLKYYYAVVTFDCADSANKIYTECDGMEYESSATKIDLRFVPDDMTFDESPKEFCDKLPDKYQPRFFTTTALQQAKVELTWDETDPDRLEFAEKINNGKIKDFSEPDLQNIVQNYVALSDDDSRNSDEEADDSDADNNSSQGADDVVDKYKALLQDIKEKEEEKKSKEVVMEISWGVDVKEKTDKLIKEKQKNVEEMTPFEKYLDKRKEKRKQKKQMKKKPNEEDSEESDFPSDVDMNDPYFAEEFNEAEFAKKPNKKKKNKTEDVKVEISEDKKAELDLILMKEEDEGKKHFSLKKIQKAETEGKGKKKKWKKNKNTEDDEKRGDDNFKVNVEDPRFAAIFTSHHYNIDPTDPHFKKTKAMETLIQEKLKRRSDNVADDNGVKKVKKEENIGGSKKLNPELSVLMKNIRRNTQSKGKK